MVSFTKFSRNFLYNLFGKDSYNQLIEKAFRRFELANRLKRSEYSKQAIRRNIVINCITTVHSQDIYNNSVSEKVIY